jgi:hypothetical protein
MAAMEIARPNQGMATESDASLNKEAPVQVFESQTGAFAVDSPDQVQV